jgi:hypothetical protein
MPCNCNNTRKNTGVTSCKSLFYALKGGIFVPTYKNDGTRNKIAAADVLNAVYVTGKLNAAEDERWYPIPNIENGTMNQADPTYETPKSGTKYHVADGVTSVTIELFEQELKYLEKLKDKNCSSWSFFPVDIYSSQLGSTDGTDMFPIKLAQGSLAAIPVFAEENTSVPKIKLTFDFSQTEFPENFVTIKDSEYTGVNLLTISGLLDVNVTTSDEGTTGFTAVLSADYGTFKNKIAITGFVIADFVSSVTASTSKLRNVTTGADVTIVSVTENPDGTYTFTYAAQTNGDVLTLAASKDGYEFPNTTVTIDHT